jgi:hypothetical protein
MIALEKGVSPPTDMSRAAAHVVSWTAQPSHNQEFLEGFRLLFVSKIWHTNLDLPAFTAGEKTLLVSRWGWHQEKWFDGPLCSVKENGQMLSILPLGEVGRLYIKTGMTASVQADEPMPKANIRRSLVWAIRARLGPHEGSIQLNLDNAGVVDALYLTVLRMAYPKQRIVVGNLPAARPERWKRLMQNLGIEYQRQKEVVANLNLNLFVGLVPETMAEVVLAEMNRISQVIPPSLFSG